MWYPNWERLGSVTKSLYYKVIALQSMYVLLGEVLWAMEIFLYIKKIPFIHNKLHYSIKKKKKKNKGGE